MPKLHIRKTLVAVALALALGLQFTATASAATDEQRLAATQAGMVYLSDNQAADGNVTGFGGVTDWAVIAASAYGLDPAEFKSGDASALDWLLANPLTDVSPATDVEKRLLAIEAAGKNLADFGGVDYGTLLLGYHHDGQVGEPALLNDDIFAVLAATGDPAMLPMANDALDYFIAHQGADGGFSYTTDDCAYCGSDSNDTAAAILAMLAADSMGLTNDGLADATDKAVAYLLSTHHDDGGFGYDIYSPSDGSSTAWALMALNALGESVATEADAAADWLLATQNDDGGFTYGAFGVTASDTYTTAHAVIALLGTTWLLQPEPLQPPTEGPTTPPAPAADPTPTPIVPVVQTKPTPAPQQEETPQVLAATSETIQSTIPPKEDKKETAAPASNTTKKTNYSWLILVGLVLVAILWFVLQSKSKQKKD